MFGVNQIQKKEKHVMNNYVVIILLKIRRSFKSKRGFGQAGLVKIMMYKITYLFQYCDQYCSIVFPVIDCVVCQERVTPLAPETYQTTWFTSQERLKQQTTNNAVERVGFCTTGQLVALATEAKLSIPTQIPHIVSASQFVQVGKEGNENESFQHPLNNQGSGWWGLH